MGVLLNLRSELVAAVATPGIYTYDHLPGSAVFPSAIVLAGSPYVESDQTFEGHLVRFELWLSAAKGDNQSETNQLDEMTEAAIAALVLDGWTVEGISQPFEFAIGNAQGYSIAITVTASGVTFN